MPLATLSTSFGLAFICRERGNVLAWAMWMDCPACVYLTSGITQTKKLPITLK
jgi:hypothetical protein